MKKLVFIVHNHQPVGNFDYVIREAFEKSYKPFIDLVYDLYYPRVCFHFSGILYEWIEKNEPLYIEKIKEMVKRNQIEILSGGYYEPILGVIPERDRVSQIKKLSSYIEKRFGFTPRGLWLTERVFNPLLPKTLNESGIEYTFVDDTHILTSGVKENEVNDYFITEYDGKEAGIFVINHNLRYLIPYKEPYKTIEYINSFDRGIFVMADDGEKFGLWPKSFELVYEKKWLYNFFETIKNSNIEMVRLVDIERKPKKLIYIPNTSYFELSQWVLLPNDSNRIEEIRNSLNYEDRKFLRGGFFDNFFTKYRQSNLIHKRSYYVSKVVADNYDFEAENYLHMAQCNCGWWHGVFGGIYLPHIRHAIYENLLKAQKIIFNKNEKGIILEKFDLDKDGNEEIIIETKNNFFILSPSYSGSIIEFSSKRRFVNYSLIMERKEEAYHLKPPRDINGNIINLPVNNFIYDWHNRLSLLDHFVHHENSLNDFYSVRYGEQGDFIPQVYDYKIEFNDISSKIRFFRSGFAWFYDKKVNFDVEKTLYINKEIDGFKVSYKIVNKSSLNSRFKFVSELVFAFSHINVAPLKEINNCREYIFRDNVRGDIKLTIGKDATLWFFPIETVSNSEAGVEKTYQGSVVSIVFDKEWNSNENFEFEYSVEVL